MASTSEEKKLIPVGVATRSREARNDAQPHRVLRHAEHNRDRCGSSFGGCEASIYRASRSQPRDAEPNRPAPPASVQVMTLKPVVLDQAHSDPRYSQFAEPFAECGCTVLPRHRRSGVDEPDHRHRRLLRARRERPRRRAPPSSVMNSRLLTRSPRRRARAARRHYQGRAPWRS